MPPPLSALVVDDSALYRQMVRNVLERIGGIEVVGTAADGEEAVRKAHSLRPEIVTLDVTMPRLDGIGVLREFRRTGVKARVIMVSSLTGEGAPATVDALLEGAHHYVLKPAGLDAHLAREQLHRDLAATIAGIARGPVAPAWPPKPPPSLAPERGFDAIAIGTSTGGPEVLRRIVPLLDARLEVPVAVVQHMPPGFTSTLARRLDELAAIRVVEAVDGMPLERGRVHVAAGGSHLVVRRPAEGAGIDSARRDKTVVCLSDSSPARHGCRPSVDVLLESMVEVYGGRLLVAILTGMGHDGAEGCAAVKAAGGIILAQEAGECAVYGMPKAVIERGLADAVLPAAGIAALLSAGSARR
jgi:two-component system chemotaxis response regulator CheB